MEKYICLGFFKIKMQMEQGQTPDTLPVLSVVYAGEN